MTKYLISFHGSAMSGLTADEFAGAGEDSRAVIRAAKEAGVYVFGGGIDEDVPPVMVSADGSSRQDTYPQMREFNGGFCVLEIPTREEAVRWAARIAAACRCDQELREFMFDPES